MTLVLAIGCTDGVVIAADSQSTDENLRQPFVKIQQLGPHPILYGGAGDVGLGQKLDEALKGAVMRESVKLMRREIKKRLAQDLRESVSLHATYPTQQSQLPPAAILLFVGVLDGKSWILEVEKENRDTVYGDDLGNFAAIGSGKMLAQALFRPHLWSARDLSAGKILAYRILDDAISLSAIGLARPIHIHTISLDGAIEKVEDEECETIDDTCEGWRQLERDSFKQVLSGQPEEDTQIPKP